MIKFFTDYPVITGLALVFIIGAVVYYFTVIRWERREMKKRKEMQDPFFDTKKFRNRHRN